MSERGVLKKSILDLGAATRNTPTVPVDSHVQCRTVGDKGKRPIEGAIMLLLMIDVLHLISMPTIIHPFFPVITYTKCLPLFTADHSSISIPGAQNSQTPLYTMPDWR